VYGHFVAVRSFFPRRRCPLEKGRQFSFKAENARRGISSPSPVVCFIDIRDRVAAPRRASYSGSLSGIAQQRLASLEPCRAVFRYSCAASFSLFLRSGPAPDRSAACPRTYAARDRPLTPSHSYAPAAAHRRALRPCSSGSTGGRLPQRGRVNSPTPNCKSATRIADQLPRAAPAPPIFLPLVHRPVRRPSRFLDRTRTRARVDQPARCVDGDQRPPTGCWGRSSTLTLPFSPLEIAARACPSSAPRLPAAHAGSPELPRMAPGRGTFPPPVARPSFRCLFNRRLGRGLHCARVRSAKWPKPGPNPVSAPCAPRPVGGAPRQTRHRPPPTKSSSGPVLHDARSFRSVVPVFQT